MSYRPNKYPIRNCCDFFFIIKSVEIRIKCFKQYNPNVTNFLPISTFCWGEINRDVVIVDSKFTKQHIIEDFAETQKEEMHAV